MVQLTADTGGETKCPGETSISSWAAGPPINIHDMPNTYRHIKDNDTTTRNLQFGD